ncbi:DUF6044 family protein [Pseudalkalibacillus caeni]|uniref:YkoS n=1 Tax=Exobacillus caeni TaxID=2574798 RepID=A0A5R9FCR2_9BACL|nr:DUF6044 family protein [Pseudalkalibacillus caeni]TLS37435.1 hypothetical protein FCL54_09820 [Pseudalkalibacillus caeni]
MRGHLQNREKTYLLIASILLAFFVSPLFILGENAHIRVHDNLDSNLAWYKVLNESGEMFGPIDARIPQVINGNLSRNAYGTEYSGIVLLHAFFPSMTAYAISQAITRFCAFLGMFLLLRWHFIKDESASIISVGVALAFSFTPFWPSGMLSTLGFPLALWAFLNIRNGDYSWENWLTLALLPLYSSLVLGFAFFFVGIGLLWLWDVVMKRKWNWPFLVSIVFMFLVFSLADYRLVHSLVFPHELTQRSEFVSSRQNFPHSLRLSLKNFIIGHTHVMTVHTVVILPLLLICLFIIPFIKKTKLTKAFLFLFMLNYALSLWYALWFNEMWQPLKSQFAILRTFNFARFHFLRPLVIYLSFAIGCYIIWRLGKRWRPFIVAAVVLQIAVLVPFNEEIRYGTFDTPTFKEFYAVEQFKEIQKFIGDPQSSYRVASIGLHPAIAQYNGFYTLDTYNNFYPLTYKKQFRQIIAKELEKNGILKRYFDDWGSRCYIFVDELGKKYEFKKDSKKKIHNLQLNTAAFKRLGGRYLLSSVPILNAAENDLMLVNTFNHPDSAWKIYLYKAK